MGSNTLTVVDLNSAPLDEPVGVFDYQPVEVGYGPCSVALLDVSGLAAGRAAGAAGAGVR